MHRAFSLSLRCGEPKRTLPLWHKPATAPCPIRPNFCVLPSRDYSSPPTPIPEEAVRQVREERKASWFVLSLKLV